MMQIQREWLIFVVIPVAYSIGFFGWCYLAKKMPIFSKRNAKSSLKVICGHVNVLLILVIFAQIGFRLYPSLPNWLTEQTLQARHGRQSIFEFSCIVAVLLIGWAEKQWIYVDSIRNQSETDNERT